MKETTFELKTHSHNESSIDLITLKIIRRLLLLIIANRTTDKYDLKWLKSLNDKLTSCSQNSERLLENNLEVHDECNQLSMNSLFLKALTSLIENTMEQKDVLHILELPTVKAVLKKLQNKLSKTKQRSRRRFSNASEMFLVPKYNLYNCEGEAKNSSPQSNEEKLNNQDLNYSTSNEKMSQSVVNEDSIASPTPFENIEYSKGRNITANSSEIEGGLNTKIDLLKHSFLQFSSEYYDSSDSSKVSDKYIDCKENVSLQDNAVSCNCLTNQGNNSQSSRLNKSNKDTNLTKLDCIEDKYDILTKLFKPTILNRSLSLENLNCLNQNSNMRNITGTRPSMELNEDKCIGNELEDFIYCYNPLPKKVLSHKKSFSYKTCSTRSRYPSRIKSLVATKKVCHKPQLLQNDDSKTISQIQTSNNASIMEKTYTCEVVSVDCETQNWTPSSLNTINYSHPYSSACFSDHPQGFYTSPSWLDELKSVCQSSRWYDRKWNIKFCGDQNKNASNYSSSCSTNSDIQDKTSNQKEKQTFVQTDIVVKSENQSHPNESQQKDLSQASSTHNKSNVNSSSTTLNSPIESVQTLKQENEKPILDKKHTKNSLTSAKNQLETHVQVANNRTESIQTTKQNNEKPILDKKITKNSSTSAKTQQKTNVQIANNQTKSIETLKQENEKLIHDKKHTKNSLTSAKTQQKINVQVANNQTTKQENENPILHKKHTKNSLTSAKNHQETNVQVSSTAANSRTESIQTLKQENINPILDENHTKNSSTSEENQLDANSQTKSIQTLKKKNEKPIRDENHTENSSISDKNHTKNSSTSDKNQQETNAQVSAITTLMDGQSLNNSFHTNKESDLLLCSSPNDSEAKVPYVVEKRKTKEEIQEIEPSKNKSINSAFTKNQHEKLLLSGPGQNQQTIPPAQIKEQEVDHCETISHLAKQKPQTSSVKNNTNISQEVKVSKSLSSMNTKLKETLERSSCADVLTDMSRCSRSRRKNKRRPKLDLRVKPNRYLRLYSPRNKFVDQIHDAGYSILDPEDASKISQETLPKKSYRLYIVQPPNEAEIKQLLRPFRYCAYLRNAMLHYKRTLHELLDSKCRQKLELFYQFLCSENPTSAITDRRVYLLERRYGVVINMNEEIIHRIRGRDTLQLSVHAETYENIASAIMDIENMIPRVMTFALFEEQLPTNTLTRSLPSVGRFFPRKVKLDPRRMIRSGGYCPPTIHPYLCLPKQAVLLKMTKEELDKKHFEQL